MILFTAATVGHCAPVLDACVSHFTPCTTQRKGNALSVRPLAVRADELGARSCFNYVGETATPDNLAQVDSSFSCSASLRVAAEGLRCSRW